MLEFFERLKTQRRVVYRWTMWPYRKYDLAITLAVVLAVVLLGIAVLDWAAGREVMPRLVKSWLRLCA